KAPEKASQRKTQKISKNIETPIQFIVHLFHKGVLQSSSIVKVEEGDTVIDQLCQAVVKSDAFKNKLSGIDSSDLKVYKTQQDTSDPENALNEVFYLKLAFVVARSQPVLLPPTIKPQTVIFPVDTISDFRQLRVNGYFYVDNFLDPLDASSFQHLEAKQSVLKAIFGVIKNCCGRGIGRVFITGVLPVTANGLSNGFNIYHDITLQEKYEHMCGFEEGDVRRGLELIFKEDMPSTECINQIEHHVDEMRKNYDGYKFAIDGDDYLSRLHSGSDPQYTTNNELGGTTLKFIKRHPMASDLLSELMREKKTSYEEINLRRKDLYVSNSSEFLKSFLFYCGGLTFAGTPNTLCTPNRAIADVIIQRVLQLYNINTQEGTFRAAVRELIDCARPAPGRKPKRFILEFKCKGVTYLDVDNNNVHSATRSTSASNPPAGNSLTGRPLIAQPSVTEYCWAEMERRAQKIEIMSKTSYSSYSVTTETALMGASPSMMFFKVLQNR
ncbi:6157_t:CDS:2, partial [Paraglomus occultum]